MTTPSANEGLNEPRTETAQATASRLIRRIHMFSALFLGPWILMYALSTLVMSHREWVSSFYTTKSPALVRERELDYSRSFPTDATREEIARQVLQDLGLDGAHSVSGGKNGRPLVIQRQHPLAQQRITFDASTSKIAIDREEFRALTFLERMHRRRGYSSYALANTWGFSVDVAVVTMVFWSLSGIWLWWEMKSARRWGTLCLLLGLGLFALFAALI